MYSYVIYIHTHLYGRYNTLAVFHLSSFTLRPTSCVFLYWRYTSSPSFPHPSTFSVPSSHDHFAAIHRPQVLIVKASPDTSSHSVCPPVRLIPQIWEGRKGIGWRGWGRVKKRAVSHLVKVFWWAHMLKSAGSLSFKAAWVLHTKPWGSAVSGCYNWDRPQGFDL